jgi:SOS response associated peptidase (SRAP)
LCRLTLNAPPHNLGQRYNGRPTAPIDVVTERDGKRELVPMRWGLVPRWWSKTIKDVKVATFNARAETVETKPFFRDGFKRTRCLISVSGYYEWQDTPGGRVLSVSPDAIPRDVPAGEARDNASGAEATSSEPKGQELGYAARVSLERTTIPIENAVAKLEPGMAVTVEVKTGSRRVIGYLLSPLLKFRQEAMRER